MTRRTAGYTLLELLVVMTVIGILTGIAYIRLGPAFTRAKVRAAANVVATDLQQAQMLAVRHRQPVVFAANPSMLRYEIRNRAGDVVYHARVFGGASEFPLDQFTASPATVEFFPNGIASGDGIYTVGFQGYQRRITATRAGQIRITNVP